MLHIIRDSLRPNRSTIHPAINVPTKAPTGNNTYKIKEVSQNVKMPICR